MASRGSRREAVEGGGIQLVLAGPGSGKTQVIIDKIRHLISSGTDADNILVLTFSEKTREDTQRRLKQYLDLPGLAVHNFHSFCLEVLRDNVLDSGINLSAGIVKREHQLVWALRHIDDFGLEHLEVGKNPSHHIKSLVEGISVFTDELVSPDKLGAYLAEKEHQNVSASERDYLNKLSDLLKVYKAYVEYKRTAGLIDFDDMLTGCSALFENKPLVLQRYQKRYTHILVDEFQDTNFAQLVLLKQLAGKDMCVVGDDDQAIYRFRGAYLTIFGDFKAYFKPNQIPLQENYRNPGNILKLALQLMENAHNREDKPLVAQKPAGECVTVATCENDNAEAEGVVREIQKHIGTIFYDPKAKKERAITPKDIAILTRLKKDGEKFNTLLRKHGIPTDFVGDLHFFQAPIIKDALAFLRVANNPIDAGPSLARIMRASGISEVSISRVNAWAKNNTRDSMSDGVFEAMLQADSEKITQIERIRELANMLGDMHGKKDSFTTAELVYDVLMCVSGLYKKSEQNEAWNDIMLLNKLVELAQQYEAIMPAGSIGDLIEFFDSLTGFDLEVEEFDDSDSIKIMTIHKSKGTEFPIVFVTDLAERHLPIRYSDKPFNVPNDLSEGMKTTENERDLFYQEERRILYVGMTRAEHKLYLVYPVRYLYNKTGVFPSPFLSELQLDKHAAIEAAEWEQEEAFQSAAAVTSQLEQVKSNLQHEAAEAINQMRLKTAIELLIKLERLRLFEAKNEQQTFDLGPCVVCKGEDQGIKELVAREDPSLIDSEFTFSATLLGDYEKCPARCKYAHVLHIPSAPKAYLSLGTTLHAVFDQTSKLEAQGYPPTREMAHILLDKSWSSAVYHSTTEENLDRAKARQTLDNFLAWHEVNPNRVLDTEYKFSTMIAGRTVNGKIDRIEQTATDDLVVVDFKTGKRKIEKKKINEDLQANIYCLAAQDKYGKLPKTVAFYYPWLSETVEYAPAEASVGMQKERIEGMIASMLSGEFPEKRQWDCRSCDYSCLCDGQSKSSSI
jgi:DNA helicase-2/ATP-dependent DNA helicase PcrA